MKSKVTPIVILFATFLLMMIAFPIPVKADCGPALEDLVIRFYSGVESAYAALKACDIDAIGYEITADQYADAIEDPNICLAPVGDLGFYQIDMCGNYTIPDFRGWENPLWGVQGAPLRQAFTLLLDRDFVVSTCCGGFADRIDQQIAYMDRGWRNQSFWYEDGTGINFDPVAAAAIMDADGWVQGSTANPYYDSGFLGSAEYIRTYPGNHSKSGQDIDPLKYCIRTDDLRRKSAGDLHTANLRKHGIPIDVVYGTSAALFPIVMDNINYHLYTGGWSLPRTPSIYVWYLYHSSNFFLGGYNYVTGNNSSNQPNYPKVDAALHAARFPPDLPTSQAALKQALGLLWGEYFVNIPLYSARSYWAWKCNVKAPVVGEGVGLENNYFFYNAYTEDGSPLRYGLITPPNELNIIQSSWYYDYQVLGRIYETGDIDTPPYDLATDQGSYLTGWTTSTWEDPDDSADKTLVTRTYRTECPGNPGVPLRFTRPVTGAQGEVLNVTQHYANLWYMKQSPYASLHSEVMDVKTTRMIGDDTMEIYWNNLGYWNTFHGSTYLVPFHTLTMNSISTVVSDELLTVDANGWTATSEPAYWITAADDTPGSGGTPLAVGSDIDMYLNTNDSLGQLRPPDPSKLPPGPHGPSATGLSGHKCTIRVINPAYYNTTIEVSYLAVGDAQGYTIGNVPWDQSLEGHGMYYIIDHTPGTGGFAALKKNPRSFREKRILGEVDFIRKSSLTCSDTFKIDIYDIVMAASAYMSQGCKVPSPHWFPGADLAPGGQCCCEVNIYDIVTIASRYGDEFDCIP